MRKILFRGKTEYGEWAEGSLILAERYCCILQDEEDAHEMDYPHLDGFMGTFDGKATPVIPETVGQYTGLTDKNGKKIFEGDILQITGHTYIDDTPFIVEWNNMYCGWYWEEISRSAPTDSMQDNIAEMSKIIGNIYDNPELLGVENDG